MKTPREFKSTYLQSDLTAKEIAKYSPVALKETVAGGKNLDSLRNH